MKRDLLAYVLLLVGVVGIGVGTRWVSGSDPMGWIGIGGGLLLAVLSYLLMRSAAEPKTSP